MEEEVRSILKAALAADSGRPKSLLQAIRARIEPLGGMNLELPRRDAVRNVELEQLLILDTNVLSELLRPAPVDSVMTWLESQSRSQLFTTSITRAEILYGVALLANGPRRQKLQKASQAIFDEDLEDKVLAFDGNAADHYARIAARRKQLGKPISQLDAMIAGIAQAHRARLVTRNVQDFLHCEIDILDPWTA